MDCFYSFQDVLLQYKIASCDSLIVEYYMFNLTCIICLSNSLVGSSYSLTSLMLSRACCCGLTTWLGMLMTLSGWRYSSKGWFPAQLLQPIIWHLKPILTVCTPPPTKMMESFSLHIQTNLSSRMRSPIIPLTISIMPLSSVFLWRWTTVHYLITCMSSCTKLFSVSRLAALDTP